MAGPAKKARPCVRPRIKIVDPNDECKFVSCDGESYSNASHSLSPTESSLSGAALSGSGDTQADSTTTVDSILIAILIVLLVTASGNQQRLISDAVLGSPSSTTRCSICELHRLIVPAFIQVFAWLHVFLLGSFHCSPCLFSLPTSCL